MIRRVSLRFAFRPVTLLALVLVLFVDVRIWAQVSQAVLSGTVTDTSGAVIPNCRLSVENVATTITRTITTNAAGFYEVPDLSPGTYEVTSAAQGFKTYVRSNITLTVGSEQLLNIVMQVGTETQTVNVSAEAPTVQLETSSLGATVAPETVRTLPLNGRSWSDLAALQPGVSAITVEQPISIVSKRGIRGFGDAFSISGGKPTENNYLLDGVSITDYTDGAPGSVLGGALGVDAIQEFSVITGDKSAQYGRTSGGVVNAVTSSGTNQFHGTGYEFLRNSTLDARNYFDPPVIPEFRRNQFGGGAGGPIRKNRTFFFADYEGIRQAKGVATVITVPTQLARQGDLSTGQVTVDPAAAKYIGLYHLPNLPVTPGSDFGQYRFANPSIVGENFFTTRIDNTISSQDSISGTYLYDKSSFQTTDSLDTELLGSRQARQVVAIGETHIFSPTVVNSFHVGYSRSIALLNNPISAINPLVVDTSLGVLPGLDPSQLAISGLPTFLGGLHNIDRNNFWWNSFQASDDVSVTRGTHALKFGANVERMYLNLLVLTDAGGLWSFGSLANFLTNVPQAFDSGFAKTLTPRNFRQTLFGAYIQDDWSVTPHLTLNLGLRYEMTTVPADAHGRLATLTSLTAATPHLGNPLFSNPTLYNFEPRLGFAWDPFKNGKTAVRGGFGLFDVLPLSAQFTNLQDQAAPFFITGQVVNPPAGSFFTGGIPLLGPASSRESFIQQNPPRSYVAQYNFNIQRQLAPNLVATVGYIGSHGFNQPFRVDDADMVLPTLTSQGYEWPVPQGSGTRPNTNFGRVQMLNWGAMSQYDALELELNEHFSHGVQLQGAFTWGKSIDDNSATMVADPFANSLSSLYWFDLRLDKAVSDFNVGRTLVINGFWDVPSPKWSLSFANWLASGWEPGGIFKVSDGTPVTPVVGGDPLGQNSSDTLDFPDRLSGPGCSSLVNPGNVKQYIKVQCFAFPSPATRLGTSRRNDIIGPGLASLDTSLFKNNHIPRISENFNVQFRVEVFNILNHSNFETPTSNNVLFDGSGHPINSAGALNATVTDSREIQFALKLIW